MPQALRFVKPAKAMPGRLTGCLPPLAQHGAAAIGKPEPGTRIWMLTAAHKTPLATS